MDDKPITATKIRVKFKYHRFRSLPKNGWSAKGWYDGTGPLPKAPRGWRWLSLGESPEIGDLCCDPRFDPVLIEYGSAYRYKVDGKTVTDHIKLTPQHHPVLRKLTVKEKPK